MKEGRITINSIEEVPRVRHNSSDPSDFWLSDVYREKASYIDDLSRFICRYSDDIEKIEYSHSSDIEEYVKIHYQGGRQDVINVFADSLNTIGLEVFRQITGEGATGLCRRVRA